MAKTPFVVLWIKGIDNQFFFSQKWTTRVQCIRNIMCNGMSCVAINGYGGWCRVKSLMEKVVAFLYTKIWSTDLNSLPVYYSCLLIQTCAPIRHETWIASQKQMGISRNHLLEIYKFHYNWYIMNEMAESSCIK